jgi:DNA-binding NarL/FixJ family response regulator
MQWRRSSATVDAVARTVLIVDDHPGFRSVARALLEGGGFEVVGEAADGAAALVAVAELRPEVVLLDVQLPDIDGFVVAEQIGSDGPVVVLTSSRSAGSFRRRLNANPNWSFIPKDELSGEALAAAVAG